MRMFTTLLLSLSMTGVVAGIFDSDIAFDGDPAAYSVLNGRYSFYATGPGSYVEFRADRSYESFVSPQKLKWNTTMNRWEIRTTKNVSGVYLEEVLATSAHPSRLLTESGITYRFPPFAGWVCTSAPYPLTSYNPVDMKAVKFKGDWHDPLSWSPRLVPRKYDNVTLSDNLIISFLTDAHCNKLTLDGGLLIGDGTSILHVHGDIRIFADLSGAAVLKVHTLRFAGMNRQKIGSNSVYNFEVAKAVSFHKVQIDNPRGVESTGYFEFLSRSDAYECTTEFKKGCFYLGDAVSPFLSHPHSDKRGLVVEHIAGAAPGRCFITNRQATLVIRARNTAFGRTFPVGTDEYAYTPIYLANRETATVARMFEVMAHVTRVPDNPVVPGRINLEYRTNAGGSWSWNITPIWDGSFESSGYTRGLPVQIKTRSGAGGWVMFGSPGVPGEATISGVRFYVFAASGPVPSAAETVIGIFQATGGARISAEEKTVETREGPYPNPANADGFRIKACSAGTAILRLTDLTGIEIPVRLDAEQEGTLLVRPQAKVSPGMYLLQVKHANTVQSYKVLIR